MKTKILASLVLGSILFSSSASANAITAASDYIAEHPDKVAKAKEALKFGFKHAKNIPKGTAVVVAGKTVKTVVKHPFLASGAFAAYATYSILSVDNAVFQIARQPEALDNYLEKNPTKITEFTEVTIKKMEEDDPDGIYSNLLEKLHVSSPPYDNNVIIRTKEEQDKLEQSKEFIQQYSMIEDMADNYDKNHQSQCLKNEVNRFINESPIDFYKKNIMIGVPNFNNFQEDMYNYDQYSYLETSTVSKLEADHIPSYKAIEIYFSRKNISTFIIKKGIRHRFLASNASAISVPKDLHRLSRTYKRLNSILAPIDALNLRIATFKDIATLLVFVKLNSNTYDYDLMKNRLFSLYERNKMLCLYD